MVRACGLQSTVKCAHDFGVSILSLNLHLTVYRLNFNSTKKGAGRLGKFYRDKHPVREILCVLLA